jgi:purine-binding chemotaxis protein CheW
MISRAANEPIAKISIEALLFELAAQRFAVPLGDVIEVVRAVAIRKLPAAPPITLGIIDVRGEILPVLDVRARFAVAPKLLDLSDQFVLAHAGPRKVALHVDRTICLMQLSMLPASHARNLTRSFEHLAGVASTEEGLVLIHDLSAFLSQAEADTLDAALAAGPGAAETTI